MADPGWYVDPAGLPQQRYFDGLNWTEDVKPFPPPSDDTKSPDDLDGTTRGRLRYIALGIIIIFAAAIGIFSISEVLDGTLRGGDQTAGSDNGAANSSPSENNPGQAPRISAQMVQCVIDSGDGRIDGAVEVTNHGDVEAHVEARLNVLRREDNTRVGDGASYTTLRPNETAQLRIVGASSEWPRYFGDDRYRCTHDAQVVDY